MTQRWMLHEYAIPKIKTDTPRQKMAIASPPKQVERTSKMIASLFAIASLLPLPAVYLNHINRVVHQPFFLSGSILLSVLVLWAFVSNRRAKFYGLPFPPGPKPLPLVGNLLQVNTAEPWLTYTAWKKKYGELNLRRVCYHAEMWQAICYMYVSLVNTSSS